MEITRFRSRRVWMLLASLALAPQTDRAESLADRLWPSVPHAHDNLRPLLTLIRQELGPEALVKERGIVRLVPGMITTDIAKIKAMRDAAEAEADITKRMEILRDAARQLTGTFLAGCDETYDGDNWLTEMRYATEELAVDLWTRLTLALEMVGDSRGAFDAARQAYVVRPDDPVVQQAVLRLTEGAAKRDIVRLLTKKVGIEDLLSHFALLEKEKQRATVREERIVEAVVRSRLATIEKIVGKTFATLAIFPGPFTQAEACAICETTPNTLEQLQALGLVRLTTAIGKENGYVLPQVLRDIARQSLAPGRYATLLERFVRYFRPNVLSDERTALIRQVVEYRLACSPTWEGIDFLAAMSSWLLHDGEGKKMMERVTSYLEQAAMEFPGSEAAGVLATFAIHTLNFRKALHWLQYERENRTRRDAMAPALWEKLLLACHHAADDALLDEMYPAALACIPIDTQDVAWTRYTANIHYWIAENFMARRRCEEGLIHNAKVIAIREARNDESIDLALAYAQRAFLLRGLGREDETSVYWNRALDGFEKYEDWHGIATCYEELGLLAAKRNEFGLACSLVERAITLYTENKAMDSRAAALATLADVRCLRGDLIAARRLLQEGLTHWEERGHPRWIARFRRLLNDVEAKEAGNQMAN